MTRGHKPLAGDSLRGTERIWPRLAHIVPVGFREQPPGGRRAPRPPLGLCPPLAVCPLGAPALGAL